MTSGTAILVKLYDPDDREVFFLHKPTKKGARKNGKANGRVRQSTAKEAQCTLRLKRAGACCIDYLRKSLSTWFQRS